jgi:hypothetical protein
VASSARADCAVAEVKAAITRNPRTILGRSLMAAMLNGDQRWRAFFCRRQMLIISTASAYAIAK